MTSAHSHRQSMRCMDATWTGFPLLPAMPHRLTRWHWTAQTFSAVVQAQWTVFSKVQWKMSAEINFGEPWHDILVALWKARVWAKAESAEWHLPRHNARARVDVQHVHTHHKRWIAKERLKVLSVRTLKWGVVFFYQCRAVGSVVPIVGLQKTLQFLLYFGGTPKIIKPDDQFRSRLPSYGLILKTEIIYRILFYLSAPVLHFMLQLKLAFPPCVPNPGLLTVLNARYWRLPCDYGIAR